MDMTQARFNMVNNQVRTWGVLDPGVLTLMSQLPREHFVPAAYKNLAYADMAIPLDNHQSMLPPREQGRILQALRIKPTDRVLEVGTGTGYLTALLAQLAHTVVSVEVQPTLHAQAQKALQAFNFENIKLINGDGKQGWFKDDYFDVICITGAFVKLPEAFKYILNTGGRLFVVQGQAPAMEATLFTHLGPHLWHEEVLYETVVPYLLHSEQQPQFEF